VPRIIIPIIQYCIGLPVCLNVINNVFKGIVSREFEVRGNPYDFWYQSLDLKLPLDSVN
jgi:hypothetical protein